MTGTRGVDGAETDRVGTSISLREWAALLPVAAVAGALLLAANWHSRIPSIFSDEAGTLGSARWLAGGHEVWRMGEASSVGIGYPLLVAPLFALVDSPARIYRLVVALNIVLALALLAVLYLLARRVLGASPRVAQLASATATAYPAVALQAGLAWVEVASMVGVALLLTTALLAIVQPRPLVLFVHGATSAYLFGLHGRFTALPALTVLALLGLAAARPRSRRWALAAAGVTVALVVALRHLAAQAQAARWDVVVQPDIRLDTLFTVPLLSQVRSAAGQGWYLIAGTQGLLVLGLVVVLRVAARVREGDGPDPAGGVSGRVAASYLGSLVASVFAISVTYMSLGVVDAPALREDYLYYGRYNECFVPVLVAVAVVALLQPRWRRTAVCCLIAAAAAVPALLGLALASRGDLPFTGVVQPRMLAAIDPLIGLERNTVDSRLFALTPTLVAFGLSLLLAGLSVVRRGAIASAVVLSVFALLAGANAQREASSAQSTLQVAQGYQLLRARHPRAVAYDETTVGVRMYYGLPFWLDDSTFVSFDSSSGNWPVADLYIGPATWPAAREHGLERLLLDRFSGRGVYVAAP